MDRQTQPKTKSPSSSVSPSVVSLPTTSSCGCCPISSCSWLSAVPGTCIRNTSVTIEATGPDHKKEFEVAVIIEGKEYARALGKSKKAAQQEAAFTAIEILQKEHV